MSTLTTFADTMADHVTMMAEEAALERYYHAQGFNDPAYLAYCEEQEGRDYPIGDMLPCFTCKPVTGELRECVGLGPVVNRADPTQSYNLECGHVAI